MSWYVYGLIAIVSSFVSALCYREEAKKARKELEAYKQRDELRSIIKDALKDYYGSSESPNK